MNNYEKQMLALLKTGRERFGVLSVKAEFEAEGTRVDELLRLLEIARRAGVKVGLKIGGCEAIRDLIECRQYGVDYIIAPMVETPYALTKYIAAIGKVFSDEERQDIGFLFNVETRSTFDQLNQLAKIASPAKVGMVFGRVDFAGSLGHDRNFVNSTDMTRFVEYAAKIAQDYGLDLVVGGGVSSQSIEKLRMIREIKLDRFETRKVIFDSAILATDLVEDALELAIEFELLWLKNKRDYYLGIAGEDAQRITMMEARSLATASAAA